MKKINISTKKYPNTFALVDDDMFEYLNQFKWRKSANGYAIRMPKPGNKIVWMHRIVNRTCKGYDTDHINRNKLDNRKSNLRTATRSENKFNVSLRIDNKSGYKGIWWWKQRNKWLVKITINQRKIYLGLFRNIKDAILAREEAENIYL